MEMTPLTVLWYGGGQDSTAILYKLALDTVFRARYVQGQLIVVISDTGNEFPETYRYLHEKVVPFCNALGIDFYHLTPNMGFHGRTWQSLQAQFERNRRVMSVAFPKSCTDNLKVKPCYNFLESELKKRYGFGQSNRPKAAFYDYVARFGKLRVLIGFGADETDRAGEKLVTPTLFDESIVPQLPKKDASPIFVQRCIEKVYPLIEMGYDRAKCQQAIAEYEMEVPPPSNCMFCPFANEIEVLYLYRKYPMHFAEWVQHESNKIANDQDRGVVRNFGVKGEMLLPEYIAKAERRYGHWTLAELENYRFSHGHCVKSRY